MDTVKRTVKLHSVNNVLLQNGSIPSGVTSIGSKYPMNIADVTVYDLNVIDGPTQMPIISLNSVDQNFTLNVDGNWSRKIKSNDPLEVERGNIKSSYFVKNAVFVESSDSTNIVLSNPRDVVHLLDSFIGITGYPIPSVDTYILLGKKMETSNSSSELINYFSAKMVSYSDDTFSLNVAWDVSSASITKLRWRSIPRNSTYSTLSFNLITAGEYSQVPTAIIDSSTGRRAEIQLTTTLRTVSIGASGSGYTSAAVYAIGGGGTGASFSVFLSGGSIVGATVTAGGTGYSSVPTLVVTGDGTGGSVSISKVKISNVSIVQQGGNYLMGPTVTIDDAYQIGITATSIIASTSLYNEGRIDYVRVLNGGNGYTGASVSISGSMYSDNATAEAEITDGSISNIKLLSSGYGYTGASVSIVSTGTGGTGAIAIANVDIFSNWVYENPSNLNEFSRTLYGFKYNIPYEIEILASADPNFRGLMKYSNTLYFQYYK